MERNRGSLLGAPPMSTPTRMGTAVTVTGICTISSKGTVAASTAGMTNTLAMARMTGAVNTATVALTMATVAATTVVTMATMAVDATVGTAAVTMVIAVVKTTTTPTATTPTPTAARPTASSSHVLIGCHPTLSASLGLALSSNARRTL